MKHETEYLILGGGPTGIGAACQLLKQQQDFHLLEAEPIFGGLSASFVDEQGFTWDLGGHVLFSHYATFDQYMEQALGTDGWLTHERESWVWIRKHWVPYPFQNNLHRLPPEERWQCVQGLLDAHRTQADGKPPPASFLDWINRTFGNGVAELFMIPYNFKVWAFPAEKLDYHWIGERVAVPDLDTVLKGICTGRDQVSWGPNATFRFPKYGGTGAIWTALGKRIPQANYSLSSPVVRIDAQNRTATTDAGEIWHYRYLISTMPLNQLIKLSGGVVPAASAKALRYSSTHLIGIGLEGCPPEFLKTRGWMYFPESNSPYYRVTVFSNYSPNNVPQPGEQWSLMAEIAESEEKPVNPAELKDQTLQALQEDGLIPAGSRPVSVVHRYLPQGYPTPFLGRDAIVNPVLRQFELSGIYSRGRFGAWKYEVANQDHSFAQGMECARRLVENGDESLEPTLFSPHTVNSRKNP